MGEFGLSDASLRKLARYNNFAVPADEVVFLALRGARPAMPSDGSFALTHRVRTAGIDYLHMNCTFVQWRTGDRTLALFPGSTVPGKAAVDKARSGGPAANMVILGCHLYAKGEHKAGQPRGYAAFRQASFLPVWRTRDDDDFDLDDSIDFGSGQDAFVWDNLHAAFHTDPTTPGFSSNGCQVVAGFPTTNDGTVAESGAWMEFRRNAYERAGGQATFRYMLLDGAESERVLAAREDELSQVVRYGSAGDLVESVQGALFARMGSPAKPDGRFGRDTLKLLTEFQKGAVGADHADGVVNPTTARALGLAMPTLDGRVPAPMVVGPPSDPVRPAGPARLSPERMGGASGLSEEAIACARACQDKWGVPASVTLAQFVLESGAGRHMPLNSNNPFGIKARDGQAAVVSRTVEVENGVEVVRSARFRRYASLAEAFDDHGRLLATAAPYRAAMRCCGDCNLFADALTGIYATDPAYGRKLRRIIADRNLQQFDLAREPETAPGGPDSSGRAVLPAGLKDPNVVALQTRLKELGYPLGEVDGRCGKLTTAALLAFQHENGVPTTGILDDATRAALTVAAPRQLDRERTAVTAPDLKAKGSTTIVDALRTKLVGWVSGVLGTIGLGNSAVMNATTRDTPTIPALTNVLTGIQTLAEPGKSNPAEIARLGGLARDLLQNPAALTNSAEVTALIGRLRQTISPELLARNPDLDRIVQVLGAARTAAEPAFTNVFGLLPGFLADGSNLQLVAKGVSAVAGSVLPGFGGSLAMIAIGLAANYLGKRIADARVEDHRTGQNLAR